MTDPEVTSQPATPDAAATATATAKQRNTLGLVALGLAVFGALLAVIPATNGFSWLFLFAGFIVGIVGLTRKNQGKTTSLVAIIVSFLFWIVSIIVGVALIAGGVSDAVEEEMDSPAISEPAEEDAADDAPAEEEGARIGDTVTTPNGVAVTLSAIEYGVANPNDLLISEVRGSLVAVKMSMTNGSSEAVSISGSSVNGTIGDAKYEAAAVLGNSGTWYVYEEINPGLTAEFTAYIDIPADAQLDTVEFLTAAIFGESAVFLAK